MGVPLPRLKRRREFLRAANSGLKAVTQGMILQASKRPPGDAEIDGPRVGFTVSKKVGNAVTRNRARRRLRALAEEVLPQLADSGHDYVLIGRAQTPTRAFGQLRGDLTKGLKRLGLCRTEGAGR